MGVEGIELSEAGAKAPKPEVELDEAHPQPVAALPPAEAPAASSHLSIFRYNHFSMIALLIQVALIILYGCVTTFDASIAANTATPAAGALNGAQYSMFQDTHVMMFLGFGFLYTLGRRYAWSGVSWNFIIAVFVLQWGVLLNGFWERVYEAAHGHANWSSIPLNLGHFIRGDYVAATVLISFGALLGRVSPAQMLGLLFWEAIISTANEMLGVHQLHTTDPGGSMFIHAFGASFGLAASYVLGDKALRGRPEQRASLTTSRHNGTFAMIGTLFLFCFWPSFNAAMVPSAAQHRVVINTLLSISVSVVSTFLFSKAIHHGRSFDMEHVQNATIAGGVVIGAACDMLTNPWGAMLAGFTAGMVATYGFSYFTPKLRSWGLSDTCGIFNLHFLPGVIGGTAAAIAAAGVEVGTGADQFSPATIAASFPFRGDRSALAQGGYQMAVTVITVVLGVASGAIGGWLIKLPIFEPKESAFYSDDEEWHVPNDEEMELESRVIQITKAELAKHLGAAAKHEAVPTIV